MHTGAGVPQFALETVEKKELNIRFAVRHISITVTTINTSKKLYMRLHNVHAWSNSEEHGCLYTLVIMYEKSMAIYLL